MLFSNLITLAALVAAVSADYHCSTNLGKFTIEEKYAQAAKTGGGTKPEKGRFPHEFHGGSGAGKTQLKFYGADARCNQKDPKLLEYPVFQDGKKYDNKKNSGNTATPARVVYTEDGKVLCGVMTHVIEDKKDHHGSGNFRVCDR